MTPLFTPVDAIAELSGGSMLPFLKGTAEFRQMREGVLVTIFLSGLPSSSTGFFALHIHEGTSCSGDGFPATGGHYNPAGLAHPLHAGDLPPLLFNSGMAYLSVMTNRFSVNDVLGRTVVIHSGPDDLHTQPSGNAGTKIACGTIRKI